MGITATDRRLRDLAAPLRWAGLVALYIAGAWLAQWLTLRPHEIVLIWPSAGVAFAALLVFGLRAWPIIPVGVALAHWWVSPVPLLFLLLSALTNTASAVAAAAIVLRLSPDPQSLRMRQGFVNLIGGIVLALVGGTLGAVSLLLADMITAPELPTALARWALGDLFGVIVVTPTLMLCYRCWQLGQINPHGLRYAGPSERLLWLVALGLSCWLVLYLSQRSPVYALGMSFLPLTLLIWAALRMEAVLAALSTTVATLGLAVVSGLGWGGFTPPQSTVEVAILMLYLSLLALIPLFFAAVTLSTRMKTRSLITRATTDRLTGLPNRGAFENALAKLLGRSEPAEHALMHLDIDQFKLINDTVSHRVGDELIRQLGSLLRAELPQPCFLARLGGDEFGVLAPNTTAPLATIQAEALRNTIERFRFSEQGRVFSLTASIGIVSFESGADASRLLQAADTACFTAKEHGGNRVQWGNTEPVNEQATAMNWIWRLNEALEHKQFSLYCQSIAALNDETLTGAHVEILLRLNDPQSGQILLPGEFILAAERFKLITRIDRHVFEQVLQWFESHHSARHRARLIAINISSASLAEPDFAEFIQTRLARSAVRPQQLCFEITETGAVRDLAHARGFISQLKALGVQFALDDFGSGFCSFGYLKSLDVDFFKIDGSFVRGVLTSPLDLTVVQSIARMARVLGKRTIAECAETAEVREALRALDVDFVQGYAVDEPMPIERYFS